MRMGGMGKWVRLVCVDGRDGRRSIGDKLRCVCGLIYTDEYDVR